MNSVCLRKRLPLVALMLVAVVGALSSGRAVLPADTAAEDSGPQVIATVLRAPPEEVWRMDNVAVDPERNRIYVVSSKMDDEKVFIIDGYTNTVTDTIVAGGHTYEIGINPTTNRIYLCVGIGLQIIDGETRTVLDHIGGIWGHHVAVDPLANRIFTHDTSGHNDLLAIIDGATHELSTVLVGSSSYFTELIPEVNPQTGLVYVTYGGDNMVTVVDPVAKTVVTKIDIGAWPGHPAINSQTNRIYLQNRVAEETVVVDGSTHSVVARIPGDAQALAVNPATNRIYRGDRGDIDVIDGTTNSVVSTFRWSDEDWGNNVRRIAVNPQTNRLYIVGQAGLDDVLVVVQDVGAASPPAPTPSPTPLPPAQGTMHNCPQASKWAISVWEGQNGADTGQALANCAAGAVDAAYYIDPATQQWLRWFAGRADISNLTTLDNMQGVIAFADVSTAAGEVRAAGSARAPQGAEQMHNCPQAGNWAISVWDGADGADTGEALAACGPGAVDFAYYIDPGTQQWLRYFVGRAEISNLLTLDDMQGVIAHGVMLAATPTPTPTPPPTG